MAKKNMYIFNLPEELMEGVIAFAALKYTPALKGQPDTITVDLTHCRKFTMLDVNYHSKFWWSNGIGRVITPLTMDHFLNMSKYVLFEIVENMKVTAVTETALVQLMDIVGDTMDTYTSKEYRGEELVNKTKCAQLHKSLIKEFKMLARTIDPEERELFKGLLTIVFTQMSWRLRKWKLDLTPLQEALVLS